MGLGYDAPRRVSMAGGHEGGGAGSAGFLLVGGTHAREEVDDDAGEFGAEVLL